MCVVYQLGRNCEEVGVRASVKLSVRALQGSAPCAKTN